MVIGKKGWCEMAKAILVVLAILGVASSADAKGKARKPVVCVDYAIVPDAKIAELDVAVCYDKHVEGGLVLRYWTEMVLPGPEGLKTVVVGYR